MAKNVPQRYGELEEAILLHLYDNPNPRPSITTYNLAGVLRKQQIEEFDSGTDDWRERLHAVWAEVQRAIESLIVKRLVKGDRVRDDKMLHFTNLKLTASKGVAEAARLNLERGAAEESLREADRVSQELIKTLYADSGNATRQPRPEFLVKPLSKLAEIWAQAKANGATPDLLNPELNRILNNWHDMESFRWLLTNPNKASEVLADEYFYSSSHCFEVGIASFLWLLAATIDRNQTCVPDPRPWESEFERLAKSGTAGFARGTALPEPPLGALEIFEGQARFSQMQFLRKSTRKYRTWSDFEQAGMFRDVYTSAFKFFCAALQEVLPSDPNDPLVAMFLLVCDVAMNPAEFLLLPPKTIQEIERAIHPGHRFVAACETLKKLGSAFYKNITRFTKEEYEVTVERICAENGWASPSDIAAEMARWTAEQPSIAQIRDEAISLTFQPMNMPVRLFFGKFLLYHEMKRTHPEVLCWPGFWAAGNDRVGSLAPLLEELAPVFIDTAEGEVKARAVEGKSPTTLGKLMNDFFSWISLYDLTRQWIMVDDGFDYDLTWLTLQYSAKEQEHFSSSIFKNAYGIEPRSLISI